MGTHSARPPRLGRILPFAVVVVGVLAASPASAQPFRGDGDEQVVLTGRLVVPEGETVGTAVIFDGDASIAGTVTETVIAFNGDVEVTGTVQEEVIAFNGRVTVRSGAEVGGDIISREGADVEDGATVGGSVEGIAGGWRWSEIGWAGRYAWWLGYTVSTLVLGLVILGLVRALDDRAAAALRRRTGGVFGFGALWFFLFPIVAALLIVAIVTIPLALFLLLGLGLVYTVAYVVGAIALGRTLVKEPRSRFVAFLAGWGVLRLIALIPIVAGLTWLVMTIVGLGVLWAASRMARELPPAAVPATVPPPPP